MCSLLGVLLRILAPVSPVAVAYCFRYPEAVSGSHVWVVDDHPIVLRSLVRLLGAKGFRVRGFATPEEVLDACTVGPAPAVLVSDYSMSGMDGGELATRLMAVLGVGAPPVVCVTGQPAGPPACARRLFADVLPKPVSVEVLCERVGWLAGERVGGRGERRGGVGWSSRWA